MIGCHAQRAVRSTIAQDMLELVHEQTDLHEQQQSQQQQLREAATQGGLLHVNMPDPLLQWLCCRYAREGKGTLLPGVARCKHTQIACPHAMPTTNRTDLTDQPLADALRLAQLLLGMHGTAARSEAEILLAAVLGCARSHLYAHSNQTLTATQAVKFQTLIKRRAAGEPVAYLIGMREFWSLELTVSEGTLIPRPDTELLVERALLCIPKDAALRIADLGTGSGAIALAIKHERPRCHVIATDISEAALSVARGNASRLGLDTVDFRCGDWCTALAGTRCAVIISNPPYIPDGDPHLAAGDVRFEPRTALTPGPEGLEAIRLIAAQAHVHLYSGGWLLLEHGYDQSAAVMGLLQDQGYREITAHTDLSGHNRVVQGRK